MKYVLVCLLSLAGCAHQNVSLNSEIDLRVPAASTIKPNNIVCAYGFYVSEYEDCRPIEILTVPKVVGKTVQCPEKYNYIGSTFGADDKAYLVCDLDR